MKELIISDREANQRLDKFLGKYMDKAPAGFFYKMMRKKNIVLNGKKVSGKEKLQPGDEIKLFLSDETIDKFTGLERTVRAPVWNQKLEVIYEDEHVLLVNKPVGMLSQKAKPGDVSLVEAVTDYLVQTGSLTQEELRIFRPGICNRLDRNTSGIVTAGKSLAGLQALSRGFKERSFGKYYRCLVKGEIPEKKLVSGYLTKDGRKNQVTIRKSPVEGAVWIETEYRPVRKADGYTLLEIHLITGKPHQIRAHLASEGYPIIGDYKYGNKKINDLFRRDYGLTSQLLHAYRLEFPQMESTLRALSGKVFYAEEPELFQQIQEDVTGKAVGRDDRKNWRGQSF